MHRFMPSDGTFCASIYAPVLVLAILLIYKFINILFSMFPPASVLVFRRDKKGRQRLVATGNVLGRCLAILLSL